MKSELSAIISKQLSELSIESKNKFFAIWMGKDRIEGSRTLDFMFVLDDEWNRVYNLNRKNGFNAAKLMANEHLLFLFYK